MIEACASSVSLYLGVSFCMLKTKVLPTWKMCIDSSSSMRARAYVHACVHASVHKFDHHGAVLCLDESSRLCHCLSKSSRGSLSQVKKATAECHQLAWIIEDRYQRGHADALHCTEVTILFESQHKCVKDSRHHDPRHISRIQLLAWPVRASVFLLVVFLLGNWCLTSSAPYFVRTDKRKENTQAVHCVAVRRHYDPTAPNITTIIDNTGHHNTTTYNTTTLKAEIQKRSSCHFVLSQHVSACAAKSSRKDWKGWAVQRKTANMTRRHDTCTRYDSVSNRSPSTRTRPKATRRKRGTWQCNVWLPWSWRCKQWLRIWRSCRENWRRSGGRTDHMQIR